MRAAVMLALLALSVGAALPVAAPAPALCADPCVVEAHSAGYLAPVVHMASGGVLQFRTSLDTVGHSNSAGTGLGEEGGCFAVTSNRLSDAPPVLLVIEDGALKATAKSRIGGGIATRVCEGATALPDGSFALPFHCEQHTHMQGLVVVSPV